MDPLTLGVFFAALAAVTLAGFVQGSSSFGFAIVAMAIVPLFAPPKFAVAVVAVCAPLVSARIWHSLRGQTEWPLVIPLAASVVLVGLPIGTVILRYIDPEPLRLVIGVALILSGAVVALRRPLRQEAADARGGSRAHAAGAGYILWASLVGAAAGVLGGLVNMTGPFLVIFVSTRPLDKHRTSATLQAVFTIGSTIRLPMLYAAGLLDAERLVWGLGLAGGGILGCVAGVAVFRRVSARTIRKVVAAVLLLAGGRQVWTGTAGLFGRRSGRDQAAPAIETDAFCRASAAADRS